MNRTLCFISYSHQDRDFVDFLTRILSLFDDSIEYWLDETAIEHGATFPNQISEALHRAEVFLPVLSANALASEWCRRERAIFTERHASNHRLKIIPIHIEPIPLAQSPFPDWISIDLSSWRRDGDRIIRTQLIDAVRGEGRSSTFEPFSARTRSSAGLNLAKDYQTVGLAINRIDPNAKTARAFVQLGVALFHLEGMPSTGRAFIGLALAGQKLQAGAWRELAAWAQSAIDILIDEEGSPRSNDELGMIGEAYNLLALAERKLGDRRAEGNYLRALESFSAMTDPLTRRTKQAQAHRELGTFALGRGRLADAEQHFTTSRELLAGLPSESMHHAQAAIKLAQLELVRGDAAAAGAKLDELRVQFETLNDARELERRVAAHYWRTVALNAFVFGDAAKHGEALERLDRVIEGTGWRNEQRQRSLLYYLRYARGFAPKPLRAAIAATIIRIGASGLRGLSRAVR